MAAQASKDSSPAVDRLKALQEARAGLVDLEPSERLLMIAAILRGIAPAIADLEDLGAGVPGGEPLLQQLRNIGSSKNNALTFIGQLTAQAPAA